MLRGDLIHIPQGTYLLEMANDSLESYFKVDKPIKALYWDDDPRQPMWSTIFYKEKIWSIRNKDIYPVLQEMENAS
tara:strand:- start:325 stop:552 length:228 start_codon:yes stop_codon:yes gene_type:complete